MKFSGVKAYFVALIANGVGPFRLFRTWWSGVELDALRDGPLDKHGVGSRILDAHAHIDEAEIQRLAEFGSDRPTADGGVERGLDTSQIKTYMDANFARGAGARRWFDRGLMEGEWPILHRIMGKGEGDERYLSVEEVRTLFVQRRFPAHIVERLRAPEPAPSPGQRLLKFIAALALFVLAAIVAIAEFPDELARILPASIARLLPPSLPTPAPIKEAHWLDQNWSLGERHWFHHATQGTATFPMPYDWFVALEQPGLKLWGQPGLMKDSDYLARFGFIPSPQSVNVDAESLRRFGYRQSGAAYGGKEESAASGVENFDGLPVGFARLAGAADPVTGRRSPDRLGLTCAACHTGSIQYKGVNVRFDGGPGMLELKKLEAVTGLSIFYALNVPGRFDRFADRVLGAGVGAPERERLRQDLQRIGDELLNQLDTQDKVFAAKGQADTEEGYGRLDALNRIGNQVFWLDFAQNGMTGFEKNLHARDAPVRFPQIWNVPWFRWAQYDASIGQPLVRNAGEALGVAALVNFSPDGSQADLFQSSIAFENLTRMEAMLGGPNPLAQKPNAFGGLASPKWPSEIFWKDSAWKIDGARVARGRALYAEICAECHLGPINDPEFEAKYPDRSFWASEHWTQSGPVFKTIEKSVAGMGTDPAQSEVLGSRRVDIPGFLDMRPSRDLAANWGCTNLPPDEGQSAPFSLALMDMVDKVARKWMADSHLSGPDQDKIWNGRSNCPNQTAARHYRVRPLNGIWATAPYLHNGSIPSLYWMLKPAAERPKQFCVGARDFDPEQVGIRVEPGETPVCAKGETRFSTVDAKGAPIHGNSNLGHSLEGPSGSREAGIIGRGLSEEERYDLIEYLKTL